METLCRYVSGAAASAAAFFAPVAPLAASALGFIAVDFAIGVAAHRQSVRRRGERWYFESRRAWRTVLKMGFSIIAIAMAWVLDNFVLDFLELRTARLFTGFICGVELWSFLENASRLSDAPLFRRLGRYVKHRIGEEAGGHA